MFSINNIRNGMYNNMMPSGVNVQGSLPTGGVQPFAMSGPGMSNPGGAVGPANPTPGGLVTSVSGPMPGLDANGNPVATPTPAGAGGFIPAGAGEVAGYNPATGQSGFVDQAQQDAYGRFTTSPDYLFRFNEGQRMLDSSAAARGTLMSGNQLRALTELGQNLASGEYGNYMNRLYGVAGLAPSGGQGMALQGGSQGLNQMFNAAGSLGTNLGNIAGAQGMATQNAWGSALGNIDFGGLASGIGGMFGNSNPSIKDKMGMF